MLIFLFFLVYRRNDKVIINSHTQSGDVGVRTPVKTSGLTISTFLLVELCNLNIQLCMNENQMDKSNLNHYELLNQLFQENNSNQTAHILF